MRDMLGNKLREGESVYWISKQLFGKVKEVLETRLASKNGKEALPDRLVVEVTAALPPNQRIGGPLGESVLGDMVIIVNPEEQSAVDRIVDIAGAQKQ